MTSIEVTSRPAGSNALAAGLLVTLICICITRPRAAVLAEAAAALGEVASAFCSEVVLVATATLALALLGSGAWCAAIGNRPTPVAMLAGVVVGVLIAGVSVVQTLVSLPVSGSIAVGIYASYILMILVGPAVEELLFRGVLWHAIRSQVGVMPTLLLTSSVFTIGHGWERMADYPFLFVGGIAFGTLREITGSLGPSLLAHTITNLTLVIGVPWVWWLSVRP